MLIVDLPAPYTARALRPDDAPAVTSLMAAYEGRLLGEALVDLEDVQADWQRPSTDLAALSVGVLDGRRLVAFAALSPDQRCEACVHPDHWGRGLGAALARWSCRVARERGLAGVGQTIPDADGAAGELLGRLGHEPTYTAWLLAMPPGLAVPAVTLPAGYRLRDLMPGEDERAAYRVIEDAFNEWPDRQPQGFDDWAADNVRRPGFQPWQLRLAVGPADQVVGACVLVLSGPCGWVSQLAVQGAHRGRGLAQALLADAFAAARACGSPRAELSTDSRTGALGLYERLGMQVQSSFTHWAKRL